MNALDTLVCTKAVLNERGWYQGSYEGENGEVCLGEAVNIATNYDNDFSKERLPGSVAAFSLLARLGNFTWPYREGELRNHASLADWNDDPERTEGEVFATLNQAIATCAVG